MQTMIGKETPPLISDLHAHVPVLRLGLDNEVDDAPAWKFVIQYNLHIKVAAGENQVELFDQVFCKWYLELREVDSQALTYPWAACIYNKEGLLIKIQCIYLPYCCLTVCA